MEITEINMFSDFQAGIKSLQNPSFLSRFFAIPGIEIISQVYSLWKWGALILAVFATFSSLIKKIKHVLIRFTVKPAANLKEEIIDFSDGDEISSASSDDEQEGQASAGTTSSLADVDFGVKSSRLWVKSQGQNGHLRQRRRWSSRSAWPEFAPGKSVVKIWDSLGFGLDFDEDLFNYDPKCVVSTWESNQDPMASNFSAGLGKSSTVYLTADTNRSGDGVVLGAYDTRMRRRTPALYAEWRSPAENVAGESPGGIGQFYVIDGVSRIVTVGDVRNVRKPLKRTKDSNDGTSWSADAVTPKKFW